MMLMVTMVLTMIAVAVVLVIMIVLGGFPASSAASLQLNRNQPRQAHVEAELIQAAIQSKHHQPLALAAGAFGDRQRQDVQVGRRWSALEGRTWTGPLYRAGDGDEGPMSILLSTQTMPTSMS